jgi:hypothetical protein
MSNKSFFDELDSRRVRLKERVNKMENWLKHNVKKRGKYSNLKRELLQKYQGKALHIIFRVKRLKVLG